MQTDYYVRAGRRPATWLDLVDEARKRLPWLGLKNLVLVMLAIWIVYFAAIHMFVRTLNKIDVPVLELPLGVFLAIQGAVIVFGVALYMFTKRRRAFGLT
jgi:putative solute:sodium symporter small subunit